MEIIEYDDKYIDDVRDLLVELEEFIVSIDKDKLDQVGEKYHQEMILYDLKLVNENNGKMYLALSDNKVVGMIAGIETQYDDVDYLDYKCPKKGKIIELIVTKKSRSGGVGKMLMKTMEEYFRKIGCEYISLEVFSYNQNAINFYTNQGYHSRMIDMIKKI